MTATPPVEDARAAPAPRVRDLRIHAGASLYSTGPCVSFLVDWGDLPPTAPSSIESWADALAGHAALAVEGPAIAAAVADAQRADGMPRAVARLAPILQRAIGHAVPDPVGAHPSGRLVAPIWDASAGADAARAATAIVAGARRANTRAAVDARAALDLFFARTAISRLGEDMVRLVGRARERGIPWARAIPMAQVVRLGDGIRQALFDGGATSRTSKIADAISNRKSRAGMLLRQHGIPVPEGRPVGSVEAAIRAAQAIGYPVVVKPVSTNTGIAVHVGIVDEKGVRDAYAVASRHGAVLVEQMIVGDHTRLLVVNRRFVSAMRLDPAGVVGDGQRSVAALIQAANVGRTPRVTTRPRIIDVDAEAMEWLERQGLTLDDVPAPDRMVRLRHGSNLSRGGSSWNVRARVHPDNARLAERAAAVLDLDIAGVDLIMPDIERSHREVGGMICEVNSGPSYYTREPGFENEDAILDAFFGGERPGRVPIVVLLADDAAAPVVDGLRDQLAALPGKVALLADGRVEIGGWRYLDPPRRSHDAAAALLGDPETGAAVFALPPATVATDGFAFDRCDLALIDPAARGSPPARLLASIAEVVVDPADAAGCAAAIGRIAARQA